MDLKKFKLGVGPMSHDVIDICLEYSKLYDYPLMIIASRNQVDATTGYVCTTQELTNIIKQNANYNSDRILICRDHCGPYFSDIDQNLNLNSTVDRCIQTITADINAGIELIHIDVGRTPVESQDEITHKLFSHALSLNPDLLFEYGSEDNTGENLNYTLQSIDKQIGLVSRYKPNLKYFVSQTGSLTKHSQVGNFKLDQNIEIAKKISNAGFLFKEHNADYLTSNEVNLRSDAGVSAVNIAPQLGTIQTSVIIDLGKEFDQEYKKFFDLVIATGYWKKWTVSSNVTEETKFLVS